MSSEDQVSTLNLRGAFGWIQNKDFLSHLLVYMTYHNFRSVLQWEPANVNKNIYKRATMRKGLIYQPVYAILMQKGDRIIFAGKYALYTGKYGIQDTI